MESREKLEEAWYSVEDTYNILFQLYARLLTRFSLTRCNLTTREARIYVRHYVTALTALFVYIFQLNNFHVAMCMQYTKQ